MLSGAECRIAEGYVCGFIGKEIAEKMNLSYNTVVRHTQNIYDKTGIQRSTNSLVAWFLEKKFNLDLSEIRSTFGAIVLIFVLGYQIVCTDYHDYFLRSRATRVEMRSTRGKRSRKDKHSTASLEEPLPITCKPLLTETKNPKNMSKRFRIELSEKQLQMIDFAAELQSRLICGQLWLGPVQDVFMEAYEKSHPGKSWQDIRDELEGDMRMLQSKYFNLTSPGASYGLHYDSYADSLWDIHKSCEHARYLSFDKKKRDQMRWTVMADPPMRFGDEPLMSVEQVGKKTDAVGLTWDDVKRIVEIADAMLDDSEMRLAIANHGEQKYYESVLSLFNQGGEIGNE